MLGNGDKKTKVCLNCLGTFSLQKRRFEENLPKIKEN